MVATLLLALSALPGCGVAYQKQAQEFIRTQPESAWGRRPPEDHKELEKTLIKGKLKDPGSAQFRDGQTVRVTISASMMNPKVVPVWGSTVFVNAKNSFGGYTGEKVWNFFYSDGELYAYEAEESGRVYLTAPK